MMVLWKGLQLTSPQLQMADLHPECYLQVLHIDGTILQPEHNVLDLSHLQARWVDLPEVTCSKRCIIS